MHHKLSFINIPFLKKTKCHSFGLMSPLFVVIILFSFSFSSKCFSQPNSFQVVLDSVGYRMQDIAVNEDGEIVLFMRKYPNTLKTDCYILPIEGEGGAVQGVKISILPTYIIRAEYYHDRVFFIAYGAPYFYNSTAFTGKSIIFNIDLVSNTKWSKFLNGRIRQNKF